MEATDNYRKHTGKNPLQQALINNFFSILLTEIEQLQPESILDVGCGEGFTLQKLQDRNIARKLEGVEYLQTAIDIGKKLHPSLHLRQGNIYELPYKDNAFDLVLCTEVLEHLDYPEKALKELKRVTRKYCVISVPHEPWFMLGNFLRGKNLSRWGNDIEHIQHWSAGGIKKFVEREFIIHSIRTPLPWTLLVGEKS